MTLAPDTSTDRSNFTINSKKSKCKKKTAYSKLKNRKWGKKDLGGYNTLLEYLDKPMKNFVPSGSGKGY